MTFTSISSFLSMVTIYVRVQQNILNAENKNDKIFVDEVETL
jgi:hypothetical protein